MTISQKRLRAAEARVLELAKAHAEICADCEDLRVAENTPKNREEWREAWNRRTKLLTELIQATYALTDRPTGPV